ncbi:hypothetical protein Tco_0862905 [Tanacetum coccineum]
MQTRSSSKFVGEPSTNPTSTIPKRRNRRRSKQRVEPFSLEENPVVTMADQRTMEQLLQAPTEGYGDAIVIPAILAENYELKHGLLNLVTSKPFYGFEKEDPHAHIRWFNKITSTIKYRDVPNSSIKLMLFPFSIEGAARIWLEKEPPRSILTWEDHNKPVVTKVSTNAPSSSSTPQFLEIDALADAVKALVLQRSPPPAFVKAVEEICVTCGGPHPYYQCLATDGVANQIRPSGFAQPNVQNNQNQFNQGYNQNRGNNQGNPVYQAPVQQTQVAPSNELSNYKKMIDTNIKAMQNQINNVKNELRNEMKTSIQTSMSNQTNELRNMMASFFQMNTASTSGAGPLPSNTIANPRGDLKAITTRSGVSYDGPPIPPPSSSLPKVVELVPEVTKDTVQPSTKNIQPSVVQTQVLIDEPVVAPNPKPTIPYPSRVNKQKLREKDDKLALKFLEIFRKLHFELSFANALLHMPKFATMFKFVDYVVDPRVPLILGIPFLRTGRALTDVYSKELTLHRDDEAVTIKVGQTSRYFYNDAESINRIDVIDIAYREYAQEVPSFLEISTSGNPTSKLIISTSSPTLTPFGDSDFLLEETDAFLAIEDDSISPEIDDSYYDSEGDIRLLEEFLNDDPSSPLPPKELHVEELKIVKSSIDDPS